MAMAIWRESLVALFSHAATLSRRAYPLAAVVAGGLFVLGPQLVGGRPHVVDLIGAPIDALFLASAKLLIASTLPVWMIACVLGARLRDLGRSAWWAWTPLYLVASGRSLADFVPPGGAASAALALVTAAGVLLLMSAFIVLAWPEGGAARAQGARDIRFGG
jgi:hypothetical protein